MALMPDAHLGKGATVGSVIPTLRAAMRGIECRDEASLVDEIPGAYKDIDQVIADSAPLVRVVHTLHQIVDVKGD